MHFARPKQFPSGFLVAALLAANGLLWAVMFFGPLAHLERLASGLTPFDIRPRGYSYPEARAFLEASGPTRPQILLQSRVGHRHCVSAALCGLAWAGVVVADDARPCA